MTATADFGPKNFTPRVSKFRVKPIFLFIFRKILVFSPVLNVWCPEKNSHIY